MMVNTMTRAILDFLVQRYPASYTTREIANWTGNTEKDVESALRRLHPCVTGRRDAIDNEVVWRCSNHYHKHPSEPAEKPEDTTAALERDVGHALLLLQGLGFKVEAK